MAISFKKLWIKLAERDIRPADLCRVLDVSPPTFTRMRQGKGVELSILEKITAYLDVGFDEIMERVPEDHQIEK